MEQLQGSLCSSLQGDPKIIKGLEDWRLCIERTRRTSQCDTFHQDAAVPHPGSGESCNGYTSWQNIGCAAHEYNIRAIEPSRYPNRETCNSASRERSAEKLGHRPTPSEHGYQASSNLTPSYQNSSQDRNVYSKSGKNMTLTGTSPPTATRWRKRTRPQFVAS